MKDWVVRLEEYANSDELTQEAQYWQNFPWSDMPTLPADFDGGECKRYVGSQTEIPSSLPEKDTLAIMNDLPRHYGVGNQEHRLDYQIHTRPALGAFNQWVKGIELESWRNRHVNRIAKKLMSETAVILNGRYKKFFVRESGLEAKGAVQDPTFL